MIVGLLALLPAVLLAIGMWRDRRLPSNAIWLGMTLALVALWLQLVAQDRGVPAADYTFVIFMMFCGLALPVVLLFNGLLMLLRERRRLANLLSLVAGLALIAVDVVFLIGYDTSNGWLTSASGVVVVISAYFGFIVTCVLLYSIVYGLTTRLRVFDVVIVLGAKVIDGRVPPLLARRLDRGIELYRKAVDAGRRPVLVVSGAQGPDETRSEAAAMADYLRERSIPEPDILLEDRARTTDENLRFSMELLEGRPGVNRIAAATNNYHAFRTAVLARSLRLPIDAVGAPTASYYLPTGFLRECAALIVRYRIVHAVAALALVVLYLLAVPPG